MWQKEKLHVLFFYVLTKYVQSRLLLFLMPLQPTAYWKHVDKRRNCSKQAISPSVTMISTLFNYCTFIQRQFPIFFGYDFKVICCRIVECGKGLIRYCGTKDSKLTVWNCQNMWSTSKSDINYSLFTKWVNFPWF